MESVTYLRNIRIAPKKLRFLQHELVKTDLLKALEILKYTPRHSARIWRKAISTAINNAKQTLKVTENMLELKALAVDQGFVMKRFRAGARGTAKSIKKRFSHIKITLATKDGIAPAVAEAKPALEAKKTEEKKAMKKVAAKKATVTNKVRTESK